MVLRRESLTEMRDEAIDCLRRRWRDGGRGLREKATRVLVVWNDFCFSWRFSWKAGKKVDIWYLALSCLTHAEKTA